MQPSELYHLILYLEALGEEDLLYELGSFFGCYCYLIKKSPYWLEFAPYLFRAGFSVAYRVQQIEYIFSLEQAQKKIFFSSSKDEDEE